MIFNFCPFCQKELNYKHGGHRAVNALCKHHDNSFRICFMSTENGGEISYLNVDIVDNLIKYEVYIMDWGTKIYSYLIDDVKNNMVKKSIDEFWHVSWTELNWTSSKDFLTQIKTLLAFA